MRIVPLLFISATTISFFSIFLIDGGLKFLSLDQLSSIILALIVLCLPKFDKSISYKDFQWFFSTEGFKNVIFFTLFLTVISLCILFIINDVKINLTPFMGIDIATIILSVFLSLLETAAIVIVWVGYIFPKFYKKYSWLEAIALTVLSMIFFNYCTMISSLLFSNLSNIAIIFAMIIASIVAIPIAFITAFPALILQTHWFLRFKSIWVVIIGSLLIDFSAGYFLGMSIEDNIKHFDTRLFIIEDLYLSVAVFYVTMILLMVIYLRKNRTPEYDEVFLDKNSE